MNYDQIINEAAKLLFGGVLGTFFTTWYKRKADKTAERKRVFIRMVASKGYYQIPQMLIDDLNMIEILFRGKKKILDRYHAYYETLCQPADQVDFHRQHGLYWDLLREIGNEVGYKNLDNKTLDNRYIPNGVVADHLQTKEFQQQLLSYLKSGQEVHKILIALYQSQPSEASPPISVG
jgi:hypothetical protein